MTTKYITSKGTLERKDNSINFKNEKGNNYIPIEGVEEIYCLDEVTLNTKIIDFLSKNGVALHMFNHYEGYSGTFYPKEKYLSGKLIFEQVNTFSSHRLKIASSIVKAIALNIHELLYHYYRHNKKGLEDYMSWLKTEVFEEIYNAKDVQALMLIEAEIWQKFYGTFSVFLKEDFVMNKRVRRPPDNPINALISFGNSILYAKTISQIYQTHLEQTISFLHAPGNSRFSLSLDLSEAFKPIIVFKTIFECVNNKKITVEKHFDKNVNYCLLNEDGRKIFISALEQRLAQTFEHSTLKRKVSFLKAIKYDGYKLIKTILEDKEFEPFNMKEKR